MFNRTVILPMRTETRYVTQEVHEHRAPTDKSVALLKEMEAAADAKRIASLSIPGNEINGLVQVHEDCADQSRTAQAIIDLNGKRLICSATIYWHDDDTDLVTKLRDEVARKVANEVLHRALAEMPVIAGRLA
jgi:hypothetical protein